MSVINTIDHGVKKMVYSIFWSFIDPLESDRLYSQLVDVLERNIDANDPEKPAAPDHFQVFVNNTVFIKHSHAIKKLEAIVRDRVQKYVANKDYELSQPKIKLQIISSATVPKKKAEILCWFSSDDDEGEKKPQQKAFTLKVISGEGKDLSWNLQQGKTYQVGRLSTCDICLPYQNVSKKQCTLSIGADARITLVDDGSTNGTFINDEQEPVKGSRKILASDKIKLCKVNPIILIVTSD
jgi:hypothetical protein